MRSVEQRRHRTQMHVMYGHDIQHSMDQPGMGVNPARSRLNRGIIFPLSPFAP